MGNERVLLAVFLDLDQPGLLVSACLLCNSLFQ